MVFRFLTITVLGAVALACAPVQAGFSLGIAQNYGVLVEPGAHSFQFNNSTVTGTVGIGAGLGSGGAQIASNGFIREAIPGQPSTGQLQFADASATVSNPGNVQGGVLFSQSSVTTAIGLVNSLSSTVGAEAGTTLTINGGGQVINANSGTLDSNGNSVFTVAANAFKNNSSGITISGTASQFVVININNGTSNESLNGPILLSGGITSDHVLFNFTGNSGNLGSGSSNGSIENAIFLAPSMAVNLDNIVIDGRLFGGQTGKDFQIVSGFSLNQPSFIIPEPSSIVLLGIGGIACLSGYFRRNRKRTLPIVEWSGAALGR